MAPGYRGDGKPGAILPNTMTKTCPSPVIDWHTLASLFIGVNRRLWLG